MTMQVMLAVEPDSLSTLRWFEIGDEQTLSEEARYRCKIVL